MPFKIAREMTSGEHSPLKLLLVDIEQKARSASGGLSKADVQLQFIADFVMLARGRSIAVLSDDA